MGRGFKTAGETVVGTVANVPEVGLAAGRAATGEPAVPAARGDVHGVLRPGGAARPGPDRGDRVGAAAAGIFWGGAAGRGGE